MEHVRAQIVLVNGAAHRFCQLCNRLHLVAQFEGGKHTVRSPPQLPRTPTC